MGGKKPIPDSKLPHNVQIRTNLSHYTNCSKRLFEKSKIQDFRELVPYIMVSERAKIVNSALTTPNTVQNHDILHFWRGKLHLARWNMQSYQSFSNSL